MAKPKTFNRKVWGIWRDLKNKKAEGQFSRSAYTHDGWLRASVACGPHPPDLDSTVALWFSIKGARDERDWDEDGVVRECAKLYGTLTIERA